MVQIWVSSLSLLDTMFAVCVKILDFEINIKGMTMIGKTQKKKTFHFLLVLLLTVGLSADFVRTDGVVTDSITLLEWQDDYSDNGGSIKSATWQNAIDYCEGLTLSRGGWRLPNMNELFSITDHSTYAPAIDAVFLNTQHDFYWTSTVYGGTNLLVGGFIFARAVGFENGRTLNDYRDTTIKYVRCVRGGN